MKKLSLKIAGNSTLNYVLTIDGKIPTFEKNEYGNKLAYIETDKDEVELKIQSFHELDSKVWFITSTLFSIISLFGLLDVRYDKRPMTFNYVGKIKLNEISNLDLKLNTYRPNTKLFTFEGDCEVEDNESNMFLFSKKIKNHLKVVKLVKLFLWIIFVSVLIAIFINI